MTSTPSHSDSHTFKSSWRWPPTFESWVKDRLSVVDGKTANIAAGLSPLGDVRVDLRTPSELLPALQQNNGMTKERFREYLKGHTDTTAVDVAGSLYSAENPSEHPAAEYIITDSKTLRADILGERLPFADDSFAAVVSDPPWLDVDTTARKHLWEELVRITKPGGRIIFNAFWIPTGDYPVTLDHLCLRQDLERYQRGTPKTSWVGVYTVHESVDIARYFSMTLTSHEFAPEPSTIDEAVRAETAFKLTRVGGFEYDDFDIDIVDSTNTDTACPHCNHSDLDPVSGSLTDTFDDGELYECRNCEFRATKAEIEAEVGLKTSKTHMQQSPTLTGSRDGSVFNSQPA